MARAKRFDRDRAEARRRYRAAIPAGADPSAETEDGEEATPVESPAPVPAARRSPARPVVTRPGAASQRPRMGIIQAAKEAYRVVHLRSDLAGLPKLLIHRSLWIPILLSLASTVLIIVTGPQNAIASFAFNVFGLPPAMASVFVAGFFAPTAAWLAGGIVGLAASIFYTGFLFIAARGSIPNVDPTTYQQISESTVSAFVIGPLYGIVLGAAAAWYKRWLYLSSPARRPASGPARSQRANANRNARGR